MNFASLLGIVAPVFVIIVAGYWVFRVGWLSKEADSSLLRVVVNLLFPCLILDTVLANASVVHTENLLLPPVAGFSAMVASYGVAFLLAPLFGIRESVKRRTFAFAVGLPNYGYVALPVVDALFGPRSVAILLIHNVGVELALWTVGIMLLSGAEPRQAWRKIVSPPVLAIALALILHFSGARAWLPAFVLKAVHSIGVAAIPLGLVLTGATFADQASTLATRSEWALDFGSALLRLGLLPLLLLAMACLPISLELRQVLIVQAAMPAGVVSVILAKHHAGSASVALRIVLLTSALGLLTIPLWLKAGLALLSNH